MLNLICDLDLNERMYKVPEKIRNCLEKEFPNIKFKYIADPNSKEILEADIYWGNRLKVLSQEKIINHNLKWVHFGSVGFERVFKSNLNLSKLIVTNSHNTMDDGIINHAIYQIFNLIRSGYGIERIRENRKLDRKNFESYSQTIKNINKSNILIVGLGSIGIKLAEKLTLLGAKVDGIKKNIKDINIDKINNIFDLQKLKQIVNNYDIVISLLPYDNNLKWLYDKTFFYHMKENSFFINLGRGIHVKEKDLIEALKTRLAAAAIDVFEEEPLPSNSKLYNLKNILLSPHVAAYDPDYCENQNELFKYNLNCFLDNDYHKMKNIINI